MVPKVAGELPIARTQKRSLGEWRDDVSSVLGDLSSEKYVTEVADLIEAAGMSDKVRGVIEPCNLERFYPESLAEMSLEKIETILAIQYAREKGKWEELTESGVILDKFPTWAELKRSLDGESLEKIQGLKNPRLVLTPWSMNLDELARLTTGGVSGEDQIAEEFKWPQAGALEAREDLVSKLEEDPGDGSVILKRGGYPYNHHSYGWGATVIGETSRPGQDENEVVERGEQGEVSEKENILWRDESRACLSFLMAKKLEGVSDKEALALILSKVLDGEALEEQEEILFGQLTPEKTFSYGREYKSRPRSDDKWTQEFFEKYPELKEKSEGDFIDVVVEHNSLQSSLPVLKVGEDGKLVLDSLDPETKLFDSRSKMPLKALVRLK